MGTKNIFDVTPVTFKIMNGRYGKEHPCQCRFCHGIIKLGDRVISNPRISPRTAWFRKYAHEECYEKSYGSFMPLMLKGRRYPVQNSSKSSGI